MSAVDPGWLAGSGGPVGVTVDHRAVALTALGTGGWWAAPRFRWGWAPSGLATRRQLSALGLRPNGQAPVAYLEWARGRRVACLYRVDLAAPKRAMTPGRARALAAALAARRRCPVCGQDAGYVVSASLGACIDCQDAAITTAEGACARRAA